MIAAPAPLPTAAGCPGRVDSLHQRRRDRGIRAYRSGLAAEETVARAVEHSGFRILERRWRGQGAEIDLIARKDNLLIFVEVKASRGFDDAAAHLQPAQLARIMRSADCYLNDHFPGQDLDCRLDLALVDGQGRLSVRKNILA